MIDLTTRSNDQNPRASYMREGVLDDVLAPMVGVDAGDVKSKLDPADGDEPGLVDKGHIINDEVLSKTAGELGKIKRVQDKNKVDTRSIVARARNSVLQFPVYMTQTNPVSVAHIISKLFERVYASFVQSVLSQNQIIDEDEANNLVFLKRFHSNLKESAENAAAAYSGIINEYYQPIDDLDAMLKESVFYREQITESCTVEFRLVPPTISKELMAENARLLNEPLSGLSYLQERKSTTQTTTQTKVEDIIIDDGDGKDSNKLKQICYNYLDAQARDEAEKKIRNDSAAISGKTEAEIKKMIDAEYDSLRTSKGIDKKPNDIDDKVLNDFRAKIRTGKVPGLKYKNGQIYSTKNSKITTTAPGRKQEVDEGPAAPVLLKDGDIKKLNGMQPWNIQATFRMRTAQGLDRDVHYVIGVKTVLHLVRTQDLADDLQELVSGDIKSLRKIRYTTGEISLVDYLFNVKQMKADAAKHINYNKRWVNTLKRLADYKKMNGSLMKKPVMAVTGGSVPIPNGTLILAQTDVTTLTNQTGVDLSKVSNAKRLCKNLFLVSIAIVDASAGTMRVLFPDMSSDWDVQSLASIDAELSKSDNSALMRELNRMVNR